MSSSAGDQLLLKTPLHALHVELGAKMVPFAGYDMPVQYPAGILAEHPYPQPGRAVRCVAHGPVLDRRRRSVLLATAIGMATTFAACGSPGSGRTTRLSIATGNTGGVYYPYGGGLAKVIGASLPGVEATAEATNASVDNLKLLQQGKVDIAFTLADTLSDAIHARGAFADGGPVPARTLAVLYPNYTHLVTVAGRGIERIADLKGKVVSVGSPNSGTEVIAVRVMRAAGVDPDKDVRRC